MAISTSPIDAGKSNKIRETGMKIPNQIAIDGPAASGKSTIGEQIAQRLDYLFFDTGVMYRAVTFAALQALPSVDDEQAVTHLAETVDIDVLPPSLDDQRKYDVLLDGKDITWQIRSPQVEAQVSQVSAYPGVRSAMTAQQRKIGLRGRVVMVGRDIGTVVLPEAELKVYLDASVEERARRRWVEQSERGGRTSYEEILSSMRRRDQIDSTRKVAPLRPADDARILVTDNLNAEDVIDVIWQMIQAE